MMRSLRVQCTPRLNIIFDDQKPPFARPIKISQDKLRYVLCINIYLAKCIACAEIRGRKSIFI